MSEQLELLTENPLHWTSVSFTTPEVLKKEIKPFVLLALKELEGCPDSRTSNLMNADKFSAIRAVVRHVTRLRSATKTPWNPRDMQTFLEGLRFSPECVSELCNLLCTEEIYEHIPKHLRVKPGIVNLQWKIDVSLSQSNINSSVGDEHKSKEIMHRDTKVILLLTLTNEETRIYRLSISKFHELSLKESQPDIFCMKFCEILTHVMTETDALLSPGVVIPLWKYLLNPLNM